MPSASEKLIKKAREFSREYRKQINNREDYFSIGHLKLNNSTPKKRAKKAKAIKILTENGFVIARIMEAFEKVAEERAAKRKKQQIIQERAFYVNREDWYEEKLREYCHEFREQGYHNPWNEAEIFMAENADDINRQCDEIFGEYP